MNATLARIWTIAAIAIMLWIIQATYRDYGVTWDDAVHARYGELVVDYFRSGFQDRRANDYRKLYTYGTLADVVPALLYRQRPEFKYEIRHFLFALMGLGAVLGVIRIGRLFHDPWVGIYAGVALVMLPRFYGHAFFNCKDIPFACFFTWSVYALCRFVLADGRWISTVSCGLAFAATLAARPGGVPLLLMLLVLATGFGHFARGGGRQLWLRAIVVWAIAWAGMVAFWPWAHQSPLLNPLRAISRSLAFEVSYPVLFEGLQTMSDQLPRYYLAKYLLITTPPFCLVLMLVGLVYGVRSQIRDPSSPVSLACFVIQFWLLAPLLLALVAHPNVYDGLRHVLFILPAVAVLAGIGAASICRVFRRKPYRAAVVAALLLVCALPTFSLVRLHPYQMTYFNGLVGGLKGAAGRYETDYWLSSYKEAIEWINEQASAQPERELSILVAANSLSKACAEYYLAPGISMKTVFSNRIPGQIPAPYTYYVATTRYGVDRSFPHSPIVHSIGRDDAVFTVIRKRSEGQLAPPK